VKGGEEKDEREERERSVRDWLRAAFSGELVQNCTQKKILRKIFFHTFLKFSPNLIIPQKIIRQMV